MDERNMSAFDRIWRARTDRRAFLLGGLALVGAGAFTRVQARPRWNASSPFSLGVASGDPTHDGVASGHVSRQIR
jgi:phosphodiesterase/alkaline phosphatase D-like protein